jgi:osmotically-inducible protein OsmY
VPKGIRADVQRGVLRLSGAVQRFGHREAAEEAVPCRPISPHRWKRYFAAGSAPRFGGYSNRGAHSEIERAVWSIPGVTRIDTQLR